MKNDLIKSPDDLVTFREDVKKGFLQQALHKIEKTEPYITRALEFREIIQ